MSWEFKQAIPAPKLTFNHYAVLLLSKRSKVKKQGHSAWSWIEKHLGSGFWNGISTFLTEATSDIGREACSKTHSNRFTGSPTGKGGVKKCRQIWRHWDYEAGSSYLKAKINIKWSRLAWQIWV